MCNARHKSICGRRERIFATNPNAANLTGADWQKITGGNCYYLFEQLADGTPLAPGTIYYVFIRLAQNETINSGLPVVKEERTRYDAYVNQRKYDR